MDNMIGAHKSKKISQMRSLYNTQDEQHKKKLKINIEQETAYYNQIPSMPYCAHTVLAPRT